MLSGAIMNLKSLAYLLLGLVLVSPYSFASGSTTQLQGALQDLCTGLRDLVPVAAMLMVLLSSVIYATGQMMGAETRARANVWSTSCLTGALVGILISVVAPSVLETIAGAQINCSGT